MKKIISIMKKAICIMLVVVTIIGICKIQDKLNEYQLSGKIYQVTFDHWVLVETNDGNLWEFDGYGFKEGQSVTVVLNDMDTLDKTDDKIVKVY